MRIRAKTLFDGDECRTNVVVDLGDDGSIREAIESDRSLRVDHEVDVLAPGLIDLQVNGFAEHDVATLADDVDVTGEGLARLDAALLAVGTTSFLPTLTTAPLSTLERRLAHLDRQLSAPSIGAVGIHLEGPFLGSRHGAHPSVAVLEADDRVAAWLDALPTGVRLVTLGCEHPGAPTAITALQRRGIVAAIGHCAPSEEQFLHAVASGATLVTHLFNAMSGIHHRDDGLALFALTEGVTVTVIPDGCHVGRRSVELAFRAKAPGTVALVSDTVGWAAARLIGACASTDGRAVRLPDGTLAGSMMPLAAGVRLLVDDWGFDPATVLAGATSTPARLLGLTDRGRVAVGLRGDFVAFTERFEIDRVWRNGVLRNV